MKTLIVALFVISASTIFAQDQNFEFKPGVIFDGQSVPSMPAEKQILFAGYYEDGIYKFVTTTKNAEVKIYTKDENGNARYLRTVFPIPGEKRVLDNYEPGMFISLITPDNKGFRLNDNIYFQKITNK